MAEVGASLQAATQDGEGLIVLFGKMSGDERGRSSGPATGDPLCIHERYHLSGRIFRQDIKTLDIR